MTDKRNEETNVEYIERLIKDFDRKSSRSKSGNPRRVGEPEREAHSEWVREAYSHGYLDDKELADRVKRASEAKFASDLEDLVDDLPSYAELRGVQAVPKKARKWTFGIGKLIHDHTGWAFLTALIAGLLVGITPSATISAAFHDQIPTVLVPVMAVTVAIGAVSTVVGFFGGLVYAMENYG